MKKASFEKFDYSLRAGKNIERKMLAEMFTRLSVFRPTSEYCYIGFGSVYFTDYALFHRLLGFSPMVSMERDVRGQIRASFNVPFGCVTVLNGSSSQCLPGIDFSRPTVVWLDYDIELCSLVLDDLFTVVSQQCEAGQSGVIILATVDAESKRLDSPKSIEDEEQLEDWPDEPIEQLTRLIGTDHVPFDLTAERLRGSELAEVYREVCTARIQGTASTFNWQYRQLVNFRYADKAKMATYGGILYRPEDAGLVEQARFENLEFYRTDTSDYTIDYPLLTFREINALAAKSKSSERPSDIPISDEDFERYLKVYRYFPSFVEAEL